MASYTIRNSGEPGKQLEVASLDLSGTLEQALDRVNDLSDKIKELRAEAHSAQRR